MPFPKSKLETRADNACIAAFAMLDAARAQLQRAEAALVEEERQHAPAVSIGNQYKTIALADVMGDLDRIRAQLAQRVTGEPV